MSDLINVYKESTHLNLNMQSAMNVGVAQQNEEIHQDKMDISTKKEIIDDTDDSFHNQQPAMSESAMERIQFDLGTKNEIGQFANIWAPRLHMRSEMQSSAESDEESNEMFTKYRIFHGKNVVVTQESLKDKTIAVLEPEITSEMPMASINLFSNTSASSNTNVFSNTNIFSNTIVSSTTYLSANADVSSNTNIHLDIESVKEDLCSKFETLFKLSNVKFQLKLTPEHKKIEATSDNGESKQYVTNSEDLSSNNSLIAVDINPLNPGPTLRNKGLYEPNADNEVCTKAGSSRDFTDALKSKYDLNTSEVIQSDCERDASMSEASMEGIKIVKRDSKDPEPVSKSSLKRSCDSQYEVPNVKYRRRCSSVTKTEKHEEENKSRHRIRCISANVKKCVADGAIGHAAGSVDNIKILPSRKRKVDKGSKTLIEECSLNSKKFKQNESAFK